MDTLMTVNNVGAVEIDMAPDALAVKTATLAAAALVQTVSDAFTLDTAAEALKSVNALLKQVEACRKQVKGPVLDLGKKIDATAAAFCAELTKEKARIGTLIATYEVAMRKEREAAERRMREEQARIRAETAQQFNAAQTDADRSAVIDAAKAQLASVAVDAPDARPKGLSLRTTLKFEVVDAAKLMASHPELFSPDEKKIRMALKINRNLPGVNVWEENKPII